MIAKKILSLFNEKLVKLEPSHIKEMQSNLLQYTKDWPEEVFDVVPDGMREWSSDGEDSTDNIKDAEVKILFVDDLVKNILDTSDLEIDFENIDDKQLNDIFDILKNKSFQVKTKIKASYKGNEDEEDGEVEFRVQDCKYIKNKGIIEVKVSNVNLVG